MNRNSEAIKSVTAHRLGVLLSAIAPVPALMAARIAALLRPPTADTNTNFGSEPSISLRISWMKDMSAMLSGYGCTRHCDRPSADALARPDRAVGLRTGRSRTSLY